MSRVSGIIKLLLLIVAFGSLVAVIDSGTSERIKNVARLSGDGG
jgi:hypothetical protein